MTKIVNSLATGIAKRTSRRGFLGRSGQLFLGLVGGSALLGLMSGVGQARTTCTCSNPCYHWQDCVCGTNPLRIGKIYDCPVCGMFAMCMFKRCTNLTCSFADATRSVEPA
jgi:hypothetical protein